MIFAIKCIFKTHVITSLRFFSATWKKERKTKKTKRTNQTANNFTVQFISRWPYANQKVQSGIQIRMRMYLFVCRCRYFSFFFFSKRCKCYLNFAYRKRPDAYHITNITLRHCDGGPIVSHGIFGWGAN